MDERKDAIALQSPHPLDRIIEREAFAEIVSCLRPGELRIARLRLEGVPDKTIAEMLGMSQAAVSQRMRKASRRIAHQRPWLAPLLGDRHHRHNAVRDSRVRPLERGWVCHRPIVSEGDELPPVEPRLSTRDVAQRLGVNQATVARWCREGRFPNAYQVNDARAYHVIPEGDLEEWEEPGRTQGRMTNPKGRD